MPAMKNKHHILMLIFGIKYLILCITVQRLSDIYN